jgi:adenylate cyclase
MRNSTFVFVDLVGFAAATETHGDELAARLAIRLADIADGACQPGDRLVKSIGDAVLCLSDSPETGLRLAAAIVQATTLEPSFPAVRTGLHHGTAVHRRGDVFGSSVNLACRPADPLALGARSASSSPRSAERGRARRLPQ